MIAIFPGMRKDTLSRMDQLAFANYDKNGDGVISQAEYTNFLAVTGVGKINSTDKKEKGFDLEQFDPQGPINFESNGGFNSTKLNIIA